MKELLIIRTRNDSDEHTQEVNEWLEQGCTVISSGEYSNLCLGITYDDNSKHEFTTQVWYYTHMLRDGNEIPTQAP